MLKHLLLVCTPLAGTQEKGPVTKNIEKAFGTKPFFLTTAFYSFLFKRKFRPHTNF